MELSIKQRVPTLDAEGNPILELQTINQWATFDAGTLYIWPSEEDAQNKENCIFSQPWHPHPDNRDWIDLEDAVTWYTAVHNQE